MARAKRTNRRAEARRRYRASLGEDLAPDEELDGDGTADDEAPSPSRRPRPAAAAATARPARPSVIGALREAFHPVDIRGDIAALPKLVRHRSFFIPLAMIVGAAGAVAVAPGESIIRSLHPYFLAPPPVAPVFLAGFLALRGSWLSGAILGLLSQALYLPLLANPQIQQSLTGAADVLPLQSDIVLNYLLLGGFGGAFYAAAAAWYKRFLALANPNRAARAAAGRSTNRPTRKGPNDRPMLARRR